MQTNDAESSSSASSAANRRYSRSPFASASVRLPRVYAICLVLLSVAGLCVRLAVAARHLDAKDMDVSVKPGDDFYRYANGGWLGSVTLPSSQTSYDLRAEVRERTAQRVRELIEKAAASPSPRGSVAQKVGDYYASFVDVDRIEANGLTPIAAEMRKISAIADKSSLSAYLGTTLNSEVDGLISNSDHIFGLWINQGFADAEHNVVHLWQGGLGMPDRDDYLDPSPKKVEPRNQYRTHIAATLKLAGISDAEAKATRILSLEIRIAQSFAPDADAADTFKQNNPWKRSEFSSKAPGMDWDAYFKSAGLAQQTDFIVWQPSAVIGVSALLQSESTDSWRDYLRFHLIEHYADVLPKAVAAEHFAFYGRILTGAEQSPDRKTSAIAAINGALGQAVGQLYAQHYFSPEAKAKAQAMVTDLISAYRARIPNLAWMSAPTKEKALAKLAKLDVIVGYPDIWIDYATLDIRRGDALGNMRRAEEFLRARNLAKLKQPVEPIEWPVLPQIPGAVIMFSPNAEFFSAGILQPPYFDAQGDAPLNYGSAGAAMAHEITHSFDELGNIYDAHGRLGDWWTAEDRTQYRAAAAKLAAQFDAYCPFADACVNGKQVLTENLADLAGLLVAHDAYILSLRGKPDVVIGGLSGEQRFFLAFSHRWRKIQSESALRGQLKTDTHAPGEYRSDTVRNLDAWYKAFHVAPGDKLYLKPEDRVGIW
jgi:putative endopeptidase